MEINTIIIVALVLVLLVAVVQTFELISITNKIKTVSSSETSSGLSQGEIIGTGSVSRSLPQQRGGC